MSNTPLVALATLLLAAAGAQADNPKPGQWSQSSSISADGQNWKPFPARKSCLTPEQASQSIEQTLQMMVSQAAQAGCRAVDLKAGNGQAKGRFECQQAGGAPGTVDVAGRYSSDHYEMSLVGTNLADRNGSGLVVPKIYMKHEGRHVGACAG